MVPPAAAAGDVTVVGSLGRERIWRKVGGWCNLYDYLFPSNGSGTGLFDVGRCSVVILLEGVAFFELELCGVKDVDGWFIVLN